MKPDDIEPANQQHPKDPLSDERNARVQRQSAHRVLLKDYILTIPLPIAKN